MGTAVLGFAKDWRRSPQDLNHRFYAASIWHALGSTDVPRQTGVGPSTDEGTELLLKGE